MQYVYIQSERCLWTVGFYENGQWYPESDHDSPEKAIARTRFMNGVDDDENKNLRKALQYIANGFVEPVGFATAVLIGKSVTAAYEIHKKQVYENNNKRS